MEAELQRCGAGCGTMSRAEESEDRDWKLSGKLGAGGKGRSRRSSSGEGQARTAQ